MRSVLLAAAIASVHTPTLPDGRTEFPVIDAYGPRVVWSDYDAAAGAWRLTERSGGATRAVPVAPRRTPFDVDLGPDGHGGTLAVYSRGGRLFAYSFRIGRETALGAGGAWPAVWGSRIAFVRGGTRLYRRSRARGAHSHRLPAPRVWRRGRSFIDGLDMRGRTIVFAWRAVGRFDTFSFIYRATTGGSLRAVARGAYVAGGAADSVRSVGWPALGGRGVDWLYQDMGHAAYRAAFLRRRGGRGVQASASSRAVAFAHAGATAYWIDAGPNGGSDGASQPGGTFPLMAGDAVAFGPVRRSYLRIRRCGVRHACRPL
jgi:hypothetical protein